jgi:hypothetical protein
MGDDIRKRRCINMNEGFQKIKISSNKSNSVSFKRKRKIHPIFRLLGIGIIVLLLLILVSGGVVFYSLKDVYASFTKTTLVASEVYKAVKQQDLDNSKIKLQELEDNLNIVKANIDKLSWIEFVPFIGVYEKDGKHLVNAALGSVQAGKISVDTLIPYQDLLGLKGKSTFVKGSADERIKTAVETLDKIIPSVDTISEKINIAKNELNAVNFDRYPEKIGNTTIRSRLQITKELFDSTASLFLDAQPLLKKIPDLLGIQNVRRYLVLFQNDAEMRATGGFLTGYGIFKIEKGKIQVETSEDIYKLDAAKNKNYPAPSPILKYHLNVNNFQIRDSNLSPDYILSMKQFEQMVKESVPGFPQYDGIIAVDTHVLVSTIKILGDFNISGRTYSADNDKRCDCPKVIYELEDYATKPVAYIRDERKDIIGTLLYQIMQRALGVSPSKYWGNLAQTFLTEAQEKHILFYFHDADAQKGIDKLNLSGRIMPYDGDYLMINDVNFAGAKSNIFVKQYVKQDIKKQSDGSLETTLTIDYKNPASASNCNLEAGQLCLNGILRNWIRVYVPKGSTLIEFTGSEKSTSTYDESEKTVFEGFMTVKPQGTAQVKVRYKVPSTVTKGRQYSLYIQQQPRMNDSEYTVIYNGKQVDKGPLTKDREIIVK